MADLSTLRAAKQALDEQLITQQDFDCVKVAFLRAQQIKAGLDAGFIKQEAYERASDAYLHALDFQLMSSLPSLSAAPASVPAPGSSATPAQSAQPVSRSQSAGHTPAVVPAPAPAAAAPAAAAPPRPSGASTGPVARPLRNSNSSSSSLLGAAANGDTQPNSPLSLQGSDEAGPDIPADLPDYCKGASRGKKSMSGIELDETCVNLFMHMKTRSSFKWLIFKVDNSGKRVVPDKIGDKNSSYNDFICALPDNQCRYAVYDYEYTSPERGTFKKLVFLLWAPDSCGMRPKMMYASTKDFFKGFLDGIGAELQANEPSELSEEEMQERVVASMTRK